MKNKTLIQDYYLRSGHRIEALKFYFERKAYAEVVRESQEVVELMLKALVRSCGIEVPHIHDLSPVILDNIDRFPEVLQSDLKKIASISKKLRRDREMAFYGTEDITPSDFYAKEDAEHAIASAEFIFEKLKFLK